MAADTFVPRFDVRLQGRTLAADVRRQVIEVTYENTLDSADMASVTLADPDGTLADGPLFAVGTTLEVHMGYGADLTPMMLGEVTALAPAFTADGARTLSVTAYDRSYRMRHGAPPRMTFKMMPDSVIAAAIAGLNLLVPIVDPSPTPPRESVQQTGSDWAFLKSLADRNGFEVFVRFDKLYFRFPRPQFQAVVLEWGRSLSSFHPRASAAGMAAIQVVRGYDPKLAQTIVAVIPVAAAGGGVDELVERLGSAAFDQLMKLGRQVLSDEPVDNFVDAGVMARAILRQLLEGLYEGRGACVGTPDLRAGEEVEIRGVGKRFGGKYRVRKATHTIGSSGYQTQFEVTQQGGGSLLGLLRKKLVESPSPNKPPREQGIAVGRVENNVDPFGLGRVQVYLPHLSDENLSPWVRVAAPFAGRGSGAFFLPDPGDEVLVAFEQGDVNRPVVVGSVWSGVAAGPEANRDGLNRLRVIRTPAGHEIRLDDTPGTGAVTISHAGGAKVVLDGDGSVRVEAAKSLTLSAKAGVTIDAGAGDVSIKATNVDVAVTGKMNVH